MSDGDDAHLRQMNDAYSDLAHFGDGGVYDRKCRLIAENYRRGQIEAANRSTERRRVRERLLKDVYEFVVDLAKDEDNFRVLMLRLDGTRWNAALAMGYEAYWKVSKAGRRGDPNIFQQALGAIFAHDKGSLDRRERERIGKQLWLAYRHYVPVEFLIGFLHQVRDISHHKGDDWNVLREYEEWIVSRAASEEGRGMRELYRKKIEKRIKKAISKMGY